MAIFQVHLAKGCYPALGEASQVLGLLTSTIPILSSITCIKLARKHPYIFWE